LSSEFFFAKSANFAPSSNSLINFSAFSFASFSAVSFSSSVASLFTFTEIRI